MAEKIRSGRISQQDKERIVCAFEEPDKDYLEMADTLQINRSTATGIIARYTFETIKLMRGLVVVESM